MKRIPRHQHSQEGRYQLRLKNGSIFDCFPCYYCRTSLITADGAETAPSKSYSLQLPLR